MPAPRKALASCKRGKRLAPQLSESERREGLDKLKAIKTKHAPKALELVRKAMCAMKGLQALEEVIMSEEAASAVHAQYNTVFSEFKLTFEAADGDLAAEMDHEFIPWAGGVQASAGGDVPRRAGGWRMLLLLLLLLMMMMHDNNNHIWVLWEGL